MSQLTNVASNTKNTSQLVENQDQVSETENLPVEEIQQAKQAKQSNKSTSRQDVASEQSQLNTTEITTEETVTAEEVTQSEDNSTDKIPTFVWWSLGGLAAVGLTVATKGKNSSKPVDPNPSVSFNDDLMGADNILSLQESQSILTLSGEVLHLPDNAVLQILVDGKALDVNVVRNGNQIYAEIDGALLTNGNTLSLKAISAEGKVLAQSDLGYSVKLTTSEQLEAEIGNITDDNMINLAESQASVNIPVIVKGLDSDAQADIILFEQNNEIGRTTVTSNGLVQIPVEGKALTTGEIRAIITATDSVGNQVTTIAIQQYEIEPSLAFDQNIIGADHILSYQESQSALTLNGEAYFLPEDAILQILVDGKALDVNVVRNGNQIYAEIDGTLLTSGNTLSLKAVSAEGKVLAQSDLSYNVKLTTSVQLEADIGNVTHR